MTPPRINPSEIDVQLAEKSVLANGIALYTLPSADFEVLRISFVFRAGSAVQAVPFSASAAANLLAEGSDRLSAQQIAEQLDYYGSWYDVNIDRDYAYISFATLSKFFDRTLDVAAEILLRPAFPEEELRTYAAKRRQRLAIDRTKVDVQAREAFAQALFGPRHPYGISSDERLYDSLTRTDVADFYRRFYTAENCFVVCSGRIGEHERQARQFYPPVVQRIGDGGIHDRAAVLERFHADDVYALVRKAGDAGGDVPYLFQCRVYLPVPSLC